MTAAKRQAKARQALRDAGGMVVTVKLSAPAAKALRALNRGGESVNQAINRLLLT